MRILAVDFAKENSDMSFMRFGFRNSCVDELKEMWSVGDEYLLPEFQRKQFGLSEDSKLIVDDIYELHGIPYLSFYIS